MYNLPIDIIRKIYEYDGTYKEYFTEKILKEISRDWAIKWICLDSGGYGIDLSHKEQLPSRFDFNPDLEYIYRLKEAKEICKERHDESKNKNKNMKFKPEHILKGDGDYTYMLNHRSITYLLRL